jgi:hypothetical protein
MRTVWVMIGVVAVVFGGYGLAFVIGVSQPIGIVLVTFGVGVSWGSVGTIKLSRPGATRRRGLQKGG